MYSLCNVRYFLSHIKNRKDKTSKKLNMIKSNYAARTNLE